MKTTTYLLGIVLGLVVPYIGIFAGLQVSTLLGNILAFPLIAVSYITGEPFGMWGAPLWIFAILLSIIIWTAIVHGIDSLVKKVIIV